MSLHIAEMICLWALREPALTTEVPLAVPSDVGVRPDPVNGANSVIGCDSS